MTRTAALKVLDKHNYTPGKSNTKGMKPEDRAEVKKACMVLKKNPEPKGK